MHTIPDQSSYVNLAHIGDLYDDDAAEGPRAPVEEAPEGPTLGIAPLPAAARVNPSLGADACPWLDRYVAFSRQWSPRAWDGFHEACALWLLSTVAARRVTANFGGMRYTNLYIAMVARTSLWAKSTTAKIAMQTLSQAGLDWLLAPDDSTPQRFVADLALRVPLDFDRMTGEQQERARARMAFAAQRGWFYEELGQKITAMMNPTGFMADFRGILRAWDDCPARYEYATIGRGLDAVERPYLALLGNLTPADLRSAADRNAALWGDGFWARFAFVTPPTGANRSRERFPEGERRIPAELVAPLASWHQALGVPEVVIEEVEDGEWRARVAKPAPATPCDIAQDVREAFYCYHDGLCDVIDNGGDTDLDGNYSRFAEKALRVAMLLASFANDGRVEMAHWARAQTITEGWRAGLHSLYDQVTTPTASEEAQAEEQVMRIVAKLDSPTANDVRRYVRGASSSEVAEIMENLANAGALLRQETSRAVRYELAP